LGIALNAPSDRIYVASLSADSVEEYTTSGQYVATFPTTGPGQLGEPAFVAVNLSSGDVYVTDNERADIVEFTASGSYVTAWGSVGGGTPGGIAVDPGTGDVYVAVGGSSVQEFTSSGTFVRQWGSNGPSAGQLVDPDGVAVNLASGDVYVTDDDGVVEFTGTGTFLRTWGAPGPVITDTPGQLDDAVGVGVDPTTGNVFVADQTWSDVQEFTAAGAYLTRFSTNDVYALNDVAVSPNSGDVYATAINPGLPEIFEFVPGRAPAITHEPVSRSVRRGASVAFFANASGDPTPIVRWQRSTDGGRKWTLITGAIHRTLDLRAVSRRMTGYRYRAVFSNGVAPAITNAAILRVR